MARVLFVCKQNAGRSQMSQAFFDRVTSGRHQSRSAGTRPAKHIHPIVVDAMREVGIELSMNQPQRLTDELAGWADIVVTMGCGDECPFIPGKKYIDWDLKDPDGKSLGEVRAIRDDVNARVNQLARDLDSRSAAAEPRRSAG